MPPPLPTATYRLQLLPHLDLDDAAELVPYLAELGVSHLYLAPLLQAAPGSTHGYDVVDHHRVDERLGGDAAHERLLAATRHHGLGQVLDVVPNHMAVDLPANAWFLDVLEHGATSRYAGHFDVDWEGPDRVLLAILGDHYDRVLGAGDIRLVRDGGRFAVRYGEHQLPLGPRSLAGPLTAAASVIRSDELLFIARSLQRLPPTSVTEAALRRERHRDVAVIGRQLERLLEHEPAVAAAVDATLAAVETDPDALDELLEQQAYRLAYWRIANQELGYRRFFDIDSLIGLRVEDPVVFDDTHERILGWVRDGSVDGLRIDHPDGLRCPADYFRRLRSWAPDTWIVVEKILVGDEQQRESWPVQGTTGYEHANLLTRLFFDPAGEPPLTALAAELTGDERTFAEIEHEARHEVLVDTLGAEVNRLAELLAQSCATRRSHRDVTRHDQREALVETAAAFDVYRTYVEPGSAPDEEDLARIGAAVDRVRLARPELEQLALDLLEAILTGRDLRDSNDVELCLRFQQLTGPVMAKAAEDTGFYRHHRCAALCEVGGDPDLFAVSVADFHDACRRTHETRPATMVTTSTHDTKRGEDVRLRLALLSELPDRWAAAVRRWYDLAAAHRAAGWHDPKLEYLLHQTVVGAHPLSADRLGTTMLKAAREAKLATSWLRPDADYEDGLELLVESLLADDTYTAEVAAFVDQLRVPWEVTVLAHKLLALTMPGIPDVYQGAEWWDLGLVDPDNRRPVDFARRREMLEELTAGAGPWGRVVEGAPKLWVVHRALTLRRERPASFGGGDAGAHLPLQVSGSASDHVVAYGRGADVVVAVPRLVVGLGEAGGWRDTTVHLPDGPWRHRLCDRSLAGGPTPAADLFDGFPVALLERSAS